MALKNLFNKEMRTATLSTIALVGLTAVAVFNGSAGFAALGSGVTALSALITALRYPGGSKRGFF